MQSIALTPTELAEVRAIVTEHLPAGTRIGVFGSRAGGRIKLWSDLDLVLDHGEPLPLATIAALREAFEESPLSFKVDIVDRRLVSPEFGRIIDAGRIDLPQG